MIVRTMSCCILLIAFSLATLAIAMALTREHVMLLALLEI